MLQLQANKLNNHVEQFKGERIPSTTYVPHLNLPYISANHEEKIRKVCQDNGIVVRLLTNYIPDSWKPNWLQRRPMPVTGNRLRTDFSRKRCARFLIKRPLLIQRPQSQKEGGRTLIGSDFDQSSSPHEPLRSALTRGLEDSVPSIRSAAALPQTPTSPLTALNTSACHWCAHLCRLTCPL